MKLPELKVVAWLHTEFGGARFFNFIDQAPGAGWTKEPLVTLSDANAALPVSEDAKDAARYRFAMKSPTEFAVCERLDDAYYPIFSTKNLDDAMKEQL